MTTGSSPQQATSEADRAAVHICTDGMSERTVAVIEACLKDFPQLGGAKLYGSRAMGHHRRGSEINLAFSSPEDCSAALHTALDELHAPFASMSPTGKACTMPPLRAHI